LSDEEMLAAWLATEIGDYQSWEVVPDYERRVTWLSLE